MHRCTLTKVIFGATAALLITAGACRETGAPQFAGPPPLPLLESMVPELSLFSTTHAGSGTHYDGAATAVAAAVASTTSMMPLSTALYDGADETDPERQSDGYHWTYLVSQGGLTYDADLKGRARGIVDAVWEMRVTSTSAVPPLSDFLLFSGRSQLDTAKGEWKVFKSSTPTTPTAILDLFWFKEGTNSWRVVFKNIETGAADVDDYLEFQSATDLRRVIYYDKSLDVQSIIEWNTSTNAGYIDSPGYNGGVKACWNSTFQNTTCQV